MGQPKDVQAAVEMATNTWPQISAVLSLPQTQEEFDRLVQFSHYLIDSGAGDESHSLASLLDIVGVLITSYERDHGLLWEQQPAS